jgi:hypothetical protein
MKNNRKGEATKAAILFLASFLPMVFIMGLAIFLGMGAFFGYGQDYREAEAVSLRNQVKTCIDKENLDIGALSKESFLGKCRINPRVIEDGEHFIYIKDKNGKEFSIGVSDFKVRCGLDARFENRGLPLCSPYKSEQYEILAASSQNSRRVLA